MKIWSFSETEVWRLMGKCSYILNVAHKTTIVAHISVKVAHKNPIVAHIFLLLAKRTPIPRLKPYTEALNVMKNRFLVSKSS